MQRLTDILEQQTWICQLHIDLYRFTLPGIREQAGPELLRSLPKAFVEYTRNEAIGWAVSLAQFWETLQDVVRRRSPASVSLLAADFMVAACCVQCTKILCSAKKYRLFSAVGERSSAPLRRHDVIDTFSLAALIQSNIDLLDQFASFVPQVDQIVSSLSCLTVCLFHCFIHVPGLFLLLFAVKKTSVN